jgi:hypothetical protein
VAWQRRRSYSCLVKLALCGLLGLLAACGGKRLDSSGPLDAADTTNTPNVHTDRMPAAGNGAPTSAASADTGAACSVLRDETLQILSDAVASAPRACAVDGDCILYVSRPDCVYDCGLTAAVSDSALIDAAVDRVDAELCPSRCLTIPSSCGGGPGPFDQPRVVCTANQCTPDTHLTVIRETFQQTLYPLLRSHCQSCHSSDSQQQVPLFADPDVARALDGALMFSWSGDGDRWSITDPEASSLVQVLSAERHHCWSDCSANASEMLATIVAWSDAQSERL